jgi:hypothetical protein
MRRATAVRRGRWCSKHAVSRSGSSGIGHILETAAVIADKTGASAPM